MADASDKHEDNVPGAWYVDTNCINCTECSNIAPAFFQEADDGDHRRVHTQPSNDDDLAICEEAKDACPVEAIGDDGE